MAYPCDFAFRKGGPSLTYRYPSFPPRAEGRSRGRRLENFTRVETFDNVFKTDPASDNVHWIKVFVDARSGEVFSYQAQIVPDNRVAVPAP